MKIVLIGFMGVGKTSVAKALARKLKLEEIDMDTLALKKSKRKTINEIFEKDGEAKFREMELVVSKEISKKDGVVISTGGGVVMNNLIMNYLKANAFVVYLKSNFDKITERVQLKKLRPPLFQDVQSARKLFTFRKPLYEKYADIIIETDNKNIDEVVLEIEKNLK